MPTKVSKWLVFSVGYETRPYDIDYYVANLKATFHDCVAIIYSYARQKQEFLGAVHLCKSKICASGAIFAASLTSKLADSALLDYQNFEAYISIAKGEFHGIDQGLMPSSQMPSDSSYQGVSVPGEVVRIYSFAAQRFASLVLCTTFVKDKPPRSNLRRLADKQACRLGFA